MLSTTMTSVDIAYSAGGFYEDCLKLLDLFKNNNTIRYEMFHKIWKEMKFPLIYL